MHVGLNVFSFIIIYFTEKELPLSPLLHIGLCLLQPLHMAVCACSCTTLTTCELGK